MHTAHGAGLLIFSVLIFAFAMEEGAHRCKRVFREIMTQLQLKKRRPRKMILISLAFLIASAFVGMGPAGYYGLNLLYVLGVMGTRASG